MCTVVRALTHRTSGDGWAWSDDIELVTDSCIQFHETEHGVGSLVNMSRLAVLMLQSHVMNIP
jgi:hypothetical protein